MSHFRNLNILNRNRIVYRRLPITDVPTEETNHYLFYNEGTHEYYDLFRSKAKITSYKSLTWHLLVLWYLNPRLDLEEFTQMAHAIVNPKNGFTSFAVKQEKLESVIHNVHMSDLDKPPKNRIRRVIFKEGCGLEKSEKLSIVGALIGRSKKIDSGDVYACMIDIHDMGKKITIRGLSDALKVSQRTIHRHMPEELKEEKNLLNREL